MNTENTDKFFSYGRGFSRIGMDFSLPQLYCHPEFIEGDSIGVLCCEVALRQAQSDKVEEYSLRSLCLCGKNLHTLRDIRGENIIRVHSRI